MQKETVLFNGFKFNRYPESERTSDRVYFQGWVKIDGERKKIRLHQYVWILKNGPIPKGYHIHHLDEDTSNNEPDNLECKLGFEHLSEHGKAAWAANREEKLKKFNEITRVAASEWHRSEEGRKWHSDLSKKSFEANRKDFTCVECGKIGNSGFANAKFCSSKCRSRSLARDYRKTGQYNESRVCTQCGGVFNTYKWNATKNCSRKCGAKYREGLRLAS